MMQCTTITHWEIRWIIWKKGTLSCSKMQGKEAATVVLVGVVIVTTSTIVTVAAAAYSCFLCAP